MLKSPFRRLAVVAALAMPAVGQAQPVSAPTADRDVLLIDAAAAVTYQSNPFALRNGPSDTILTGLLGVRFDREFSLQRITADASIEPIKYMDFSRYDTVNWRAGLNWDWEVGRPLFGTFTLRATSLQTPFDSINFAQDNQQDIYLVRGLAGFRMTQSWSVFGAADYTRITNSAFFQTPADQNIVGFEGGLRYSPQTATEFDFFYRHTDGEYPNRQVFDSTGNLLPAAIDNAYSQDALLVRASYIPSDAFRVTGVAGWTTRSYDNLDQRDFSGPTLGLDFRWAWTGTTSAVLSLVRTIDAAEYLTANYIDVRGIAFRPTYRATGKLYFDGLLSYFTRSYDGDPLFVITDAPVRKDKTVTAGVRMNYEFSRTITGFMDLRYEDRSSNYDVFDFNNTLFGVGVRATF